MLQTTNYKLQTRRGFTLIELVVGVTIFSVVLSITLGAFISSLRGQRQALAIQSVQDNARFAFEVMAKEIRTGRSFSLPNSSELRFINDKGVSIVYRRAGTLIERSDNGGISFLAITSDEISVSALTFKLVGPAPGDGRQPLVTVMSRVQGVGLTEEQKVSIELQTSVSQKNLDI